MMALFHHEVLHSTLHYVLISFGSLCMLVLTLILCAGSKKERISHLNEACAEDDVARSSQVVVQIQPENEIQVNSSAEKSVIYHDSESQTPASIETASHRRAASCNIPLQQFQQYEASGNNKSVSLPRNTAEHPYASISKDKIIHVTAEDSGNSGNSENSNYERVKNVKKEESAYLVVDIKESSEKYDVVGGDIVRKLPSPEIEEEETFSEHIPQSPSRTSSLYAKVDTNRIEVNTEVEQENSGCSGYYASVSHNQNKEEITTVEEENSGNSGYYAACGPVGEIIKKKDTEDVYKPIKQSGLENEQDPYEMINDNGTYDQITRHTEVNAVNKKVGGKLSKDTTDANKKKPKSEKKEKHSSKQKEKFKFSEDTSVKQSSRLSKVNPFKQSKKQRKSEGNISIDINSIPHHETPNPPSSARSLSFPPDLQIQRSNSEEESVPPPPPSVDKLKHLTEHRKTCGSQDGFSSSESSPRANTSYVKRFSASSVEKHMMKRESNVSSHSVNMEILCTAHQEEFSSDNEYKEQSEDHVLKTNETSPAQEYVYESVDNTKRHSPPSTHHEPSVTRVSLTSDNEQAPFDTSKNEGSTSHEEQDNRSLRSNEYDCTDIPSYEVTSQTKDEQPYASVDLEKKARDEQVDEMYASVDRAAINHSPVPFVDDVTPLYEGSYRIIPEIEAIRKQSSDEEQNDDDDYECLNTVVVRDEDDMLPTFNQNMVPTQG